MSLVEVLVGIAVMVPLTLTAMTGMLIAVETSSSTEVRQELEVGLATATEDLKTLPYLQCGSVEEYQKLYQSWSEPLAAAVRAEEQPAPPAITSVEYWNRGKDAYTDSCGGDDGAQRIVVTVSNGQEQVTGSVVKRDESARVGNSG